MARRQGQVRNRRLVAQHRIASVVGEVEVAARFHGSLLRRLDGGWETTLGNRAAATNRRRRRSRVGQHRIPAPRSAQSRLPNAPARSLVFKNLIVHRLAAGWSATPADLEELLATQRFVECSATQAKSAGWVE